MQLFPWPIGQKALSQGDKSDAGGSSSSRPRGHQHPGALDVLLCMLSVVWYLSVSPCVKLCAFSCWRRVGTARFCVDEKVDY
jgi:hypothetical protein